MTNADENRPEALPLEASFDALGRILDLLSQADPFGQYPLAQITRVVRDQLRFGANVAVKNQQDVLIGYAGWIHTSKAAGQLWVEDKGSLKVLAPGTHDAVALTIVLSREAAATTALIRAARNLNPGARVYFRRGYDNVLRTPKKISVLNFEPPD